MEVVLRRRDSRDIVERTEPEPTEAAQLLRFKRRKDTPLSHIILRIDDSCSAEVTTLRDPTEIWN